MTESTATDSGTSRGKGHHRSAYRSPEPVAKRVCGEIDRLHSAGEPGPRERAWRQAPPKDLASILNIARSRGLICRQARKLTPPALCSRRSLGPLWKFRRLVACITATNGVLQPEIRPREKRSNYRFRKPSHERIPFITEFWLSAPVRKHISCTALINISRCGFGRASTRGRDCGI